MEFEEAKNQLIKSLENIDFKIYTDRPDIEDKNKLSSFEVDEEFVLGIIENCNEKDNYFPKYSWDADDYKSHVFIKSGWYVKYILKDGIVYIISVHEDL